MALLKPGVYCSVLDICGDLGGTDEFVTSVCGRKLEISLRDMTAILYKENDEQIIHKILEVDNHSIIFESFTLAA